MARVWKIAIVVCVLSGIAAVALITATIWTDQQPTSDHLGSTATLVVAIWLLSVGGLVMLGAYEANR